MKTDPTRPMRSVLYMPAHNARAVAKARTLPCDAMVLDLEDAVAPEHKADARAALVAEAQAGGFGARPLVARINALAAGGADDLAALAAAPLAAVLAPKVDDAADIDALSAAMDAAGFPAGVALWVMIETPRAALAVERIADRAAHGRLAALVLGLNDLAKDTGMAQAPGRAAFVPVLSATLLAGRANGLLVLDGVCNAIDDPERLEGECLQARAFGYDGKTLIHPAQVAIANRVFAPSAEDISEAEAIVAAFSDPAHAGAGALRVNGRMAERLHRDMAERLLARAEAIANRTN